MTKQDIEIMRTDVLYNEKGKQTHAFGQNVLSCVLQSEVHGLVVSAPLEQRGTNRTCIFEIWTHS